MRLWSLLYKMPSGRAAMETLRGIGGIGTGNTALPLKLMHFNFLIPTEEAVNKWDDKHAVDPDFKLGTSVPTARHICATTKGPLRIAIDAVDAKGIPGYECNGTFAAGDVSYTGGFDSDGLNSQYHTQWESMLPFVKDGTGISGGGEGVEKYLASCESVASFLSEKVGEMEENVKTIKDQIQDRKDKYTNKQIARRGGGKSAPVGPTKEWREGLKEGSPVEVLDGKVYWLARVSETFRGSVSEGGGGVALSSKNDDDANDDADDGG